MENFSITKLESQVGVIGAQGGWNPLTEEMQLHELILFQDGVWVDVSFWLSEQEFEEDVARVVEALKLHLIVDQERI